MTGRYVVFGAGAVGGVLGARLFAAGDDVLLVARGEHGRSIAKDGLRVDTPEGTTTFPIPVVNELRPGCLEEGDVVLVTTKSQDSAGALAQLVAAAPPSLPIVCAQNGTDNERGALRLFENVYGMLVVLPATHLEPGVVVASASPVPGVLDIGRYPGETDRTTDVVAGVLRHAGFHSEERPDVMAWKRTKLLFNLANALQALSGVTVDTDEIADLARAEGRACFAAAGLDVVDDATFAERTRPIRSQPIDTGQRGGGSSWQSMARGLTTIESDYLNGEIALLGRLHGVATPVNALLQRLAGEQARNRSRPGSVTPDTIRSLLAARS